MIPNELRGKKAVPFLELDTILLNELNKKLYDSKLGWKSSLNITEAGIYMSYIQEYLARKMQYNTFYSQPFSIEMLVNPIQKKEFKNNLNEEENAEVGDIVLEWQQAEERVLFEGWDRNSCYSVIKSDNGYKLLYCDEFVMCFYTINDFITLCNLSEINLTFKK